MESIRSLVIASQEQVASLLGNPGFTSPHHSGPVVAGRVPSSVVP